MGEKIRPISLPENGKKDYDHRFFSVPIGQRPQSNSWPPNLQLNPTFHDIIVLIHTVQTPVIQPGSAIPFWRIPLKGHSRLPNQELRNPSGIYFLHIIMWQPNLLFCVIDFFVVAI